MYEEGGRNGCVALDELLFFSKHFLIRQSTFTAYYAKVQQIMNRPGMYYLCWRNVGATQVFA